MKAILKAVAKHLIGAAGYELVHANAVPRSTLMGLARHEFDLLIDIGANKGEFCDYFRNFYSASRAWLYEPLAIESAGLARKYSADPRVTVVNCALGKFNGPAHITRDVDHSPSSSLLESTALNSELFPQTVAKTKEMIQVRRLDDVFPMNQMDGKSVFVKIDAQGYEMNIISGGIAVLAKADVVLMEVNVARLYEGQADFFELHEVMHNLKYSYFGNFNQAYDSLGRCIYFDALFKRQDV